MPERHSFLGAECYPTVWIDHTLCTHSSIDGHLGSFHLLAIVIRATTNIGVQLLFEHLYSVLLGIYLEVELWAHMVTLT